MKNIVKKRSILFAIGLEAILLFLGIAAIIAGGLHPGGAIFNLLHMPSVLLIVSTGIELGNFSFAVLSAISQGFLFFFIAYSAQWLFFKIKGAK